MSAYLVLENLFLYCMALLKVRATGANNTDSIVVMILDLLKKSSCLGHVTEKVQFTI